MQETFRKSLENNWKNPNQRILSFLENNVDDEGYPTVSKWNEFLVTENNDLEVYQTLMYFLINRKLPLPLANISSDITKNLFLRYKTKNISSFKFSCDYEDSLIHRLSKEPYQYEYDNWTLGYFPKNMGANKISNYFAQEERMKCEVMNKETPIFLWTEEHGISRLLDSLRRMKMPSISKSIFRQTFTIAGQFAAQFNVNTSKNLYNLIEGTKVFDISSGWGDRLTGFYLSDKEMYIGTDPNAKMFEIYKEMCKTYESWLGNKNIQLTEYENYFELKGIKTVRIYNLPAEDLPYEEIPNVDVTFSSPPYFNKELYGKDSEKEDNQSWKRYTNDDQWLNNFLYVVMDNMIPKSKTTMINITDIGIGSGRKRICDPMVNNYKDKFVGIAGFELARNMNVAKEVKGVYTEPIWVFGEFPTKKRNDLTSFFS